MRNAVIKALCEEAKKNPKVMLLTGDLGFNIIEPFVNQFPDQFINMGVAEANLITVSAGLARAGFIPFAYSIATFASARPFEQIRNDVVLQNLNVKIIGVGGGLAYSKAGPTHHSQEDMGLMRLLPDIAIVSPYDQDNAYEATKALVNYTGPAYLRIDRNPASPVPVNHSFKLGKGLLLKTGKKIAILATGTKVSIALNVFDLLKKKKISPSVYAFPTVQPLDNSLLKKIATSHDYIVTIEEHRVSGGFGTGVLEAVSVLNTQVKVIRIGMKNGFTPISASYDNMIRYHGLTPVQIAKHVAGLK